MCIYTNNSNYNVPSIFIFLNLGMQLIRRNDEIALLLEKIRLQESALKAGEIQYNERLNDIQILKTKIRDINREYNLTRNSHTKISDLKRSVFQLEKDLLQVTYVHILD